MTRQPNPTANAPVRTRAPRALALLSLAGALLASGGCMPPVDLKRMTYEALRREDCRLNQLDQFCQRTFANEYAEYERLRRQFIRDAGETAGRDPRARVAGER